jgi:ABC-type Fe3+/spermidine/putrescine transport system ATPase subunit
VDVKQVPSGRDAAALCTEIYLAPRSAFVAEFMGRCNTFAGTRLQFDRERSMVELETGAGRCMSRWMTATTLVVSVPNITAQSPPPEIGARLDVYLPPECLKPIRE